MTREEAIKNLEMKSCFGCRYGWKTPFDCEYTGKCEHREAVIMAIKALEQEPILEKIRAEIKALPVAFTSSFEMKQDCLKIIASTRQEVREHERRKL